MHNRYFSSTQVRHAVLLFPPPQHEIEFTRFFFSRPNFNLDNNTPKTIIIQHTHTKKKYTHTILGTRNIQSVRLRRMQMMGEVDSESN